VNYLKYLVHLVVLSSICAASAGSFDDFFRAVRGDNANAVTALLARGFDPNAHDEKGQTALGLAVRERSDHVVDALLKHPQLDVNQRNSVGETALMFAALQGRLELVDRLIAHRANVTQDGWNPLHYAATGPEPKVVALLLRKGAPIDARSPNGTTALMMAARHGSEQSVTLLLERGADAKVRNERGMNAAEFARSAGRDALAKRLESRLQ
jgi:ankyrin repeat protein